MRRSGNTVGDVSVSGSVSINGSTGSFSGLPSDAPSLPNCDEVCKAVLDTDALEAQFCPGNDACRGDIYTAALFRANYNKYFLENASGLSPLTQQEIDTFNTLQTQYQIPPGPAGIGQQILANAQLFAARVLAIQKKYDPASFGTDAGKCCPTGKICPNQIPCNVYAGAVSGSASDTAVSTNCDPGFEWIDDVGDGTGGCRKVVGPATTAAVNARKASCTSGGGTWQSATFSCKGGSKSNNGANNDATNSNGSNTGSGGGTGLLLGAGALAVLLFFLSRKK